MTWESMLFVCVMVFLAGFVDSVAGGGGIISLPAYIFVGLPPHQAYGCNKFSSAFGTTFSAARFFLNGTLDLKVALVSAVGSFIGSGIASKIVLLLDEQVLKGMLVFILPIVAVIIMFKRNYGEENLAAQLQGVKVWILAMAIGFLIGGYDGLFGPGTGTFAIFAYTMIMKYDLRTASGNAKVLNLASNYASLVTFAFAGTILYKIAIPAAICGIVGNYIGSGFAIKRGAKFIRPMMLVVMVLLLGKMLIDFFI